MSTFIKIRILHIAALIYIWIILFASIMLSYLIYSTKINEYLVIFLSIILMTIFSCLFAFIGFYLFNYILKRISYKNSTISINFKLSKPNLPSIEIDDNTRTYYRIKRHLNTITIYNTNNLDVKKFRIMSKKSRHIVRKNILIANEQYSRKRHWQLDISILAFQTLSTNSLTELISKINKYDSKNKNIYYKEILIKRTKTDSKTKEKITLNERMIVTFSPKYAAYQKNIRDSQITRAKEIIEKHPEQFSRLPQNNAKRFIQKENITNDGECAEKYKLYYKESLEKYESQFDGLYALCVPEKVKGNIEEILQISRGRWEIEESFRIMKSEFKARPVYLHLEERIKAHFTICYISLLIYRILEKEKLKDKYTTEDIISTLKDMLSNKIDGLGFKQLYKKTEISTDLNSNYDFDLDQKFISLKSLKKFLKL